MGYPIVIYLLTYLLARLFALLSCNALISVDHTRRSHKGRRQLCYNRGPSRVDTWSIRF